MPQSGKNRIPSTLFWWDILTIILVLGITAVLFQRLLIPFLLDAAHDDILSRHQEITTEYQLGIDFISARPQLDSETALELLNRNLLSYAGELMLSGSSLVQISQAESIFSGSSIIAQGELVDGRVLFSDFPEPLSASGYLASLPYNEVRLVRVQHNSEMMIGTASLFPPTELDPVPGYFLLADAEQLFNMEINRIRNLFWIMSASILTLVLALKLIVTRQVSGELKSITKTILSHRDSLLHSGDISGELEPLTLNFRETGELYNAFSDLNTGLERVGDVLGGIADTELFVATLKNDSSVLEPHREHMAIVFIDIVGFTSISEAHKTEAMAIVNNIWDCVEQAVLQNEGKINKFIGDACLSIFPGESSAKRAMDAAILIMESIPELRRELSIDFSFRIGCDVGELTYGKTGSMRNYELGVIGDPVNTAARLESLNKQYGSHFLCTGEFLTKALDESDTAIHSSSGNSYDHFEIDLSRPKGKRESRQLFTLVSLKRGKIQLLGMETEFANSILQKFTKLTGTFRKAISVWNVGDNSRAREIWKKLAGNFAKLYSETGFPPAYPYLVSLLQPDELYRYEKTGFQISESDPIAVRDPDEEWIQYGSREMGK